MTEESQAQPPPTETPKPTEAATDRREQLRGCGAAAVLFGSMPLLLFLALLLGLGGQRENIGFAALLLIAIPMGGILLTIGVPLLVAASTDDPARRAVRAWAAAGILLLIGALVHLGLALLNYPHDNGFFLGAALGLGVLGALILLWVLARSKAT